MQYHCVIVAVGWLTVKRFSHSKSLNTVHNQINADLLFNLYVLMSCWVYPSSPPPRMHLALFTNYFRCYRLKCLGVVETFIRDCKWICVDSVTCWRWSCHCSTVQTKRWHLMKVKSAASPNINPIVWECYCLANHTELHAMICIAFACLFCYEGSHRFVWYNTPLSICNIYGYIGCSTFDSVIMHMSYIYVRTDTYKIFTLHYCTQCTPTLLN